ncbi:Hypothetical predicted protein [Paramuricea clavata]|uniref:Reverse transcriptase domain-containing protein n=2 Tax=Paramuricea clavata TaxID=317549 RepID=A0A6S7JX93_PARCT|nr:Hypothetical predicted protein [Paramuricea clavata]
MDKKVNSDETIKRVQNYRQQRQRPSSQIFREQSTSSTREKTTNPCNRCGYDRAHKQCPAMGSLCNACGKRNHYAKVCRSKPAERFSNSRRERQFEGKDTRDTQQSTSGERNRRDRKMPENKNVKHVTYNRDRSPSTESSTSSDSDLVNHLKIHRTTGDETTLSCVVYINGHKTLVEPDTGADSNIMDEIQLQELKTKSPEIQLYESKVKLNTLKEKLPVKGECIVTIENETRITQAPMVIIKGKINSLPLIGRTTLEELGMVKIDETGRLKEPNKPSGTCNIRKLQETQSSDDELLKPYQDLFHGICRATRNGEENQLHLPMDEQAEPVAQKPRRVAYHLMEPLQKRLQEFVEQDIMEKVPDQEPITWCSAMVVQPIAKNPNDIRLSLDLRTLNKSMLRNCQVQAPITEDFITAFKDCRIFSKFDLNHGYHQFVIDTQSRQAMTFSTPWGNYRYKRLAFGGVNSQDLFDGEMANILSGIPRTLNNRDDIMIGGVDLADHDKNLKIVLGRLKDYNLTLRQEKCEYRKSILEFHGH